MATQRSTGAFCVTEAHERALDCDELAPPPLDAQLPSIEEFRLAKRLQHG